MSLFQVGDLVTREGRPAQIRRINLVKDKPFYMILYKDNNNPQIETELREEDFNGRIPNS